MALKRAPRAPQEWRAFVRAVVAAARLGGYGDGKAVQLRNWRELIDTPDAYVQLVGGDDRFAVVVGGEYVTITQSQWRELLHELRDMMSLGTFLLELSNANG